MESNAITIKLSAGIIATTLTLTLSFIFGCGLYAPAEVQSKSVGYEQTGKASYYAKKYQSRRTANGEKLDNRAMTGAHRTLPFGSKVLVTNLGNSKSVTVTINDRGPFVKGRIIDLTRAAFAEIGDLKGGVIKVKIEVIN